MVVSYLIVYYIILYDLHCYYYCVLYIIYNLSIMYTIHICIHHMYVCIYIYIYSCSACQSPELCPCPRSCRTPFSIVCLTCIMTHASSCVCIDGSDKTRWQGCRLMSFPETWHKQAGCAIDELTFSYSCPKISCQAVYKIWGGVTLLV